MISQGFRGLFFLLLISISQLNTVYAATTALGPYCAAVCAQIIADFSFSDCQPSTRSGSGQGDTANGRSSNSTSNQVVSKATTKAHGQDTSCYCQSKYFAESYALCIQDHCLQDDSLDLWAAFARSYCTTSGNVSTSSPNSVKISGLLYTEALNAASKQTISFVGISASKPVTAPISITASDFDPYYRSYDTAKYQKNLGTTHGYVLVGYLAAFIVLASFKRMFVYALQRWRSSRKAFMAYPNYLERRCQQWILYPSIFDLSTSLHRYPMPVRSHSLIVAGYVILALALCLASYTSRLFNENTNYRNDKSAQLVKYLADRTGMMAVSQLPFLFLFGGRNNIMMFLTGWSFKIFNLYHKWVGRVMWALAFVHTIAYTISYLWSDRYSSSVGQLFFIYGIVALSCSSIIMVQAVRLIRTKAYETFLVLHIILAAVFLLGMWYHLVLKHNAAWMPYVYTSIAVWAFDRLARLTRVAYYNVGIKTTSTADITVVENATKEDSILLINIYTARIVDPKPGQHIFVHFRSVCPWQAHPFTIMDHDRNTGTIRLAAKVHTGLTRALYNHATANALTNLDEKGQKITSDRKLRVAIDGFYGHTAPIAVYDTVLLVAGSAGVTAVFPYVRHLLESGRAQTRHIRMVWIVRHSIHLEMLRPQLEEIHARVPEHMTLDVELYASATHKPMTCGAVPSLLESIAEKVDAMTTTMMIVDTFKTTSSPTASSHVEQGNSSTSTSTSTSTSPPTSPLPKRPNSSTATTPSNPFHGSNTSNPTTVPIPLHHSRPDLASIVTATIEEAPVSVAVLACGPESLMRAVRVAVCGGLERGRGRVGLFEEAFEW